MSNGSPGGAAGRTLVLWSCVGSLPAEIFLHKGMGRRTLGVNAVFALVQMIAFLFLFGYYFTTGPHQGHPYYDPTPLGLYFVLFLFWLVLARLGLWWRERQGEIEHSRYNGFPHLLPPRLARFERSFKLIVEPALVLILGLKVWDWNMPLGFYLCFNAFCMCWGTLVNWRCEGRRSLDMRDAMIEQRMHAQSLRRLTHRF